MLIMWDSSLNFSSFFLNYKLAWFAEVMQLELLFFVFKLETYLLSEPKQNNRTEIGLVLNIYVKFKYNINTLCFLSDLFYCHLLNENH